MFDIYLHPDLVLFGRPMDVGCLSAMNVTIRDGQIVVTQTIRREQKSDRTKDFMADMKNLLAMKKNFEENESSFEGRDEDDEYNGQYGDDGGDQYDEYQYQDEGQDEDEEDVHEPSQDQRKQYFSNLRSISLQSKFIDQNPKTAHQFNKAAHQFKPHTLDINLHQPQDDEWETEEEHEDYVIVNSNQSQAKTNQATPNQKEKAEIL